MFWHKMRGAALAARPSAGPRLGLGGLRAAAWHGSAFGRADPSRRANANLVRPAPAHCAHRRRWQAAALAGACRQHHPCRPLHRRRADARRFRGVRVRPQAGPHVAPHLVPKRRDDRVLPAHGGTRSIGAAVGVPRRGRRPARPPDPRAARPDPRRRGSHPCRRRASAKRCPGLSLGRRNAREPAPSTWRPAGLQDEVEPGRRAG